MMLLEDIIPDMNDNLRRLRAGFLLLGFTPVFVYIAHFSGEEAGDDTGGPASSCHKGGERAGPGDSFRHRENN